MTKKIEISIEKNVNNLESIHFPGKCVFCGAQQENTYFKEVIGRYTYKDTSGWKNSTKSLGEIGIPYCEKHFKKIQMVDSKSEKLQKRIDIPIFIFSASIMLLLLFRPMYNWGIDVMQSELGDLLGSITTGLAGVVFISLGPGLILKLLLSALINKIFLILEKPPVGVKINADTNGTSKFIFDFKNDEIADEFLKLNHELNAHVY